MFAASPDYVVTTTTGASIVPGTDDIGNHGDDVVTNISLPFAVAFYDQVFTSANVSSNGNLQFSSGSFATRACIPFAAANNVIAPYWTDLLTDLQSDGGAGPDNGIFTSISGTAPNRIFNIEWRTADCCDHNNQNNFEIRLYEGRQRIDFVYGTMTGTNNVDAGVGVQRDTGSQTTFISCGTTPTAGTQYTFTFPCVPPPPNMVGWWRGDGNADDSVGGNHGSLIAGVTFGAGEVGQAFSFSGGSAHVVVPHSPALNPVNEITIDAWVRSTGTGFQVLVGKAEPMAGNAYDFGIADATHLYWRIPALTPFGLVQPEVLNLTDGEWHHVAGTYDGSEMVVYFDGQPVGSESATGNIGTTDVPLVLGAYRDGDGSYSFALEGELDEVELFNRALDASEILAIYGAGPAGKCKCTEPPANMVSWWPGEGDGNDIQDGNNATLNNILFAAGEVGQAFVFDGSTSDINVPASSNLDVGAGNGMTVDMWIKPDSAAITNSDSPILAEWNANAGDAGIGTGLLLNRDGGNNLAAGALEAELIDVLGNGCAVGTGPGVIVANEWQHVAFTYDKTSGLTTIYVNGSIVAGPASCGSLTLRTNTPLDFGIRRSGSGGARYAGQMDEMEVFSRALTSDEIQAIYHAGSAGKCRPCTPAPSGMTNWWPGDNNANDVVGGDPGTLQNGATFGPGKVEQAFDLDGTNDYVDLGDVDLPVTFTIDAWINPQDLSSTPDILNRADNSSTSYEFYISTAGALRLIVGNTSGDFTSYISDAAITTGSWQHVAVTYDGNAAGTKIRFFVNGVPLASSIVATFDNGGTPADIPLTAKIGIFGLGSGHAFHGLIDELEVFANVLPDDAIRAIYDAGSGGKCKPAIPVARQLANISSRASVGTGDNVEIGGFIVQGDNNMMRLLPRGPGGPTKQVLIRGIGPSLEFNGMPVAGRLQDPVLELHDEGNGGALLETNDNWGDAANATDIQASGLAPSDANESAILVTLNSDNAYTAILRGAGGTTGIGLVEVYDLEVNGNTHLANISTRSQVLTGDDVLIGGIICTRR